MNTTLESLHDEAIAGASLPRLDMYGAVHKGLRWALCDLLVRMAQCADDHDARQPLLDDLDGLLYLLDSHAAHEDAHLHRALEARHAGASAPLAHTHERLEALSAEVRRLASRYGRVAQIDRPAAFRALYLSFSRLSGEHLAHMSEEESYSQALLERLYSHEELLAVQGALLRSIGPDEMTAFLRIMAIGGSSEERVAILARFRAQAAQDAFVGLLGRVLPWLDGDERSALLRALRTTS